MDRYYLACAIVAGFGAALLIGTFVGVAITH